mmetsp:Transcript_53964/g.110120  ORF Transcript_53964/g.110120 Transcript_53964/m.110120 type:complete len:326 (-) Transcript_53964:812-1789(-)
MGMWWAREGRMTRPETLQPEAVQPAMSSKGNCHSRTTRRNSSAWREGRQQGRTPSAEASRGKRTWRLGMMVREGMGTKPVEGEGEPKSTSSTLLDVHSLNTTPRPAMGSMNALFCSRSTPSRNSGAGSSSCPAVTSCSISQSTPLSVMPRRSSECTRSTTFANSANRACSLLVPSSLPSPLSTLLRTSSNTAARSSSAHAIGLPKRWEGNASSSSATFPRRFTATFTAAYFCIAGAPAAPSSSASARAKRKLPTIVSKVDAHSPSCIFGITDSLSCINSALFTRSCIVRFHSLLPSTAPTNDDSNCAVPAPSPPSFKACLACWTE